MPSSLTPFFNKLHNVVDQHLPILHDANLDVYINTYDSPKVQLQHVRYKVYADWFGSLYIYVCTVNNKLELSMAYDLVDSQFYRHQTTLNNKLSIDVFHNLLQGQKMAFNLASELQEHVDEYNKCS